MTNREVWNLYCGDSLSVVEIFRLWNKAKGLDEPIVFEVEKLRLDAKREEISNLLQKATTWSMVIFLLACLVFGIDDLLFKGKFLRHAIESLISKHLVASSATFIAFIVLVLTRGFFGPKSTEFMDLLDQFLTITGKRPSELPDEEAGFRELGNRILANSAFQVLLLEKENKDVPREHWVDEAKKRRGEFEFRYSVFSKLGISGGPYGKFYAKAKEMLSAQTNNS